MSYDELGNVFEELDDNTNFEYFSNNSTSLLQKTKKNKAKIFREFSIKKKKKYVDWIPKTIYAKNFLLQCFLDKKIKSKNLAVVGHLHHGKSSLINNLTKSVHLLNDKLLFKDFSNFFYLEKQKRISIYVSITTLLLCDSAGKSFLYTLLDTPGHPDFFDQTISAINISDGIILVIDIVEGILLGTEMVLRHAIITHHQIVLIINGIDKMIIDLREKPINVLKKIIRILDELNYMIQDSFGKEFPNRIRNLLFFNPIQNNVIFSSFLQNWSFSLDQYAEIYLSAQPSICLSKKDLVARFWNNISSRPEVHFFQKSNPMFVDFVLIPLYNVIFFILGESVINIRNFFENEMGLFGIKFSELSKDNDTVVSYALSLFLGGCREVKILSNYSGLISSLNTHISFENKDNRSYFRKITAKKNLIAFVGKLFPSRKERKFLALTKIIHGTMNRNSTVCILSEGHQLYFQENFFFPATIKTIFLPIGRYNLSTKKASKGSIILLEGIQKFIRKSCIITDTVQKNFYREEFITSILRKLSSSAIFPVLNLMIEPTVSQNLNFLYFAMRKTMRLYPALSCKILSSGEFLISGTGYLYLDCVIHDIKNVFGELDLKVSQLLIDSRETSCTTEENRKFYLSKAINLSVHKSKEYFNHIDYHKDSKFFNSFLKMRSESWCLKKKTLRAGFTAKQLGIKTSLNLQESNNVWIVGPQVENFGSCKLVVKNKNVVMTKTQKQFFLDGFEMAVSKGPLAFETVNEIKFRLTFLKNKCLDISENFNNSTKIRRIFHWLLLKNHPKLQTPRYFCEIVIPISYHLNVLRILKAQEGRISSMKNLLSENVSIMRFTIPAQNALNFESNLRNLAGKTVSCFFQFDKWTN